ncbi:hypothetical protein QA635_33885 [Bradyrhizobium brasilense]|uniref:hypothetical protein n=1 Tax=Bradyrhizobium brasilense TaxID=1419277 RepID=UPI0024B26BB4|nr:hypothetical protein [Bradyrhizobium australafricanum]WFU31474.1 hypothetical protein QA635_33885 [Bradyrhizobium australafricanum]
MPIAGRGAAGAGLVTLLERLGRIAGIVPGVVGSVPPRSPAPACRRGRSGNPFWIPANSYPLRALLVPREKNLVTPKLSCCVLMKSVSQKRRFCVGFCNS